MPPKGSPTRLSYSWDLARSSQALPFRKVLDLNAKIWESLLRPERSDTARFKNPAVKKEARVNGDLGLKSSIDLAHWEMTVHTPVASGSSPSEITVTMADLKKLP